MELASRSEERRRNPRPMRVSVSQALHGAIISFLSHLNGPAIQVREFPERSTATPAVFTKSAPVPPTPTRRAKGPAIFPILLQDSSMSRREFVFHSVLSNYLPQHAFESALDASTVATDRNFHLQEAWFFLRFACERLPSRARGIYTLPPFPSLSIFRVQTIESLRAH